MPDEDHGSSDPLGTVLTEISQVLAKVSRREVEDLSRRQVGNDAARAAHSNTE